MYFCTFKANDQLPNHGINFCPRFKRRDVILLPNNVPKEMVFEVDNLPHPQAGHTGFQCITNIEDAKMLVPARVESSRYIVCEKTIVSTLQFIRFVLDNYQRHVHSLLCDLSCFLSLLR